MHFYIEAKHILFCPVRCALTCTIFRDAEIAPHNCRAVRIFPKFLSAFLYPNAAGVLELSLLLSALHWLSLYHICIIIALF
jgi:hypothetical protein